MKKLSLILLAGVAIFATSCKEDPVASFSADSTEVNIGDVVTFTNTSTEAFNPIWDFGDGEWSRAMNPTHIYYDAGTYEVTLEVSDNKGELTVVSTSSITVMDTLGVLNEASQEERDARTAEIVGNWDLEELSTDYSDPFFTDEFDRFTRAQGEFMADGTILYTDDLGNKSTGSFNVINKDYMTIYIGDIPGGLYEIKSITSRAMKLEMVDWYTDFNDTRQSTTYTAEFGN